MPNLLEMCNKFDWNILKCATNLKILSKCAGNLFKIISKCAGTLLCRAYSALKYEVTWIRVWRIFGYSNIFEYFPIRIFVRIIFVSFVWYEYIRIFVRIIFLIQIYSDIHSYHFFDMNIFGYSFVLFFGKKYIRIFIRIKNSYSPHPDQNLIKLKSENPNLVNQL